MAIVGTTIAAIGQTDQVLKAYEYLGHSRADFPVAARHQEQMLSLPIYPEMTDEQQEYVAQEVIAAVNQHG